MKKRLLTIFVAMLCAFSLCVFFACGSQNGSDQDDSSKNQQQTQPEHVHDWIKGTTTQGTCQTKSYTTYTCSSCGQTKTEEGALGAHVYENHVCKYDGVRQNGEKVYTSGNCKFYLYEATRTISGIVTYLLVATGSGAMPDFNVTDTSDNRPWYAKKAENNFVLSITEVEIDEGITSIGKDFMKNAPMVRSVKLASSVRTIGESAFENCSSTEFVAFTADDAVTTVKENAFKNCRYLRKAYLGANAKNIGAGAFSGCALLQTISFGGALTGKTGAEMFFGNIFDTKTEEGDCEQVVKDDSGATHYFDLPNYITNVEIIGDGVIPARYFENVKKVRNVYLKGGVTEIGTGAFRGMSDLRYVSFEQETLIKIGDDAFALDNSLGKPVVADDATEAEIQTAKAEDPTLLMPQKIVIPASVKVIGKRVFQSCASMTSITFSGNQLTEIPEAAFFGCSVLAKFNVPTDVVVIAADAFYASGVKEIHISENVKTVGRNAFPSSIQTVYIDSENIYCAQRNDMVGGLYTYVVHVYVREDVVGTSKDAKTKDLSYVKQNFVFKGLDEELGYYLWERQ